jgi:hypothetical protein
MYPFHWLPAGTSGTRAQSPGLCSTRYGPAVNMSCHILSIGRLGVPRQSAAFSHPCSGLLDMGSFPGESMQGVMRGIVAPSPCTHPERAKPVETAAVCVLEEPLVAYPPVFFLRPGCCIPRHRRANQQSHLRPEIRICLIGSASKRPNFLL